MAIQNNFPNIQPTLNLSFALTKALDPRITFARASAATYYGTETAKAEENLLIRSQEFDNAGWGKANVTVTANSTTAPDGTSTAETLIESATTAIHILQGGVGMLTGAVSGQAYAFSIFMKKGTGATAPDVVQITFASGGFGTNMFANFNLSTGAVSSAGAGVTSSSITDVGGGWYRCSLIADATATANTTLAVCFVNNNGSATRAPSYAGAITSDVFLWGAQLEQRSTATAYTPTTDQPITNYIPVLESAAAGEARFDHNPNTFESLGLLIEEQRTNSWLQSQFAGSWTPTRATLQVNDIVAPDGTLTGARLFEDTSATSTHIVTQGFTFTSGTTYAVSFFAKAAGRNQFEIRASSQAVWPGQARFDLSTGTIVLTTNGTASITSVGNGWYRCSVAATANATGTTGTGVFLVGGGTINYTGDGFSGIFIWGASLEEGAFPTSYIPTTTAQVTRAGDAASMTGANFSSWYNQGEGALYGEAASVDVSNVRTVFAVKGSGTSEYIFSRCQAGGTSALRINQANTLQASFTFNGAYANNTFAKAAVAYKTNDSAGATNGVSSATDTVCTIPLVDRIEIGAFAGTNVLNGTVKKIAYYPIRVTDAQLQSLTG